MLVDLLSCLDSFSFDVRNKHTKKSKSLCLGHLSGLYGKLKVFVFHLHFQCHIRFHTVTYKSVFG